MRDPWVGKQVYDGMEIYANLEFKYVFKSFLILLSLIVWCEAYKAKFCIQAKPICLENVLIVFTEYSVGRNLKLHYNKLNVYSTYFVINY